MLSEPLTRVTIDFMLDLLMLSDDFSGDSVVAQRNEFRMTKIPSTVHSRNSIVSTRCGFSQRHRSTAAAVLLRMARAARSIPLPRHSHQTASLLKLN